MIVSLVIEQTMGASDFLGLGTEPFDVCDRASK